MFIAFSQMPRYEHSLSAYQWVNKTMCHTYTMEYYSALIKNEILPLPITWINLEGMLNEISQATVVGETQRGL